MPTITTTDQTSLFYEVHGSGKVILFIHPPGMGHVTFRLQLPLASHYKVLTFDLRGNGKSGSGQEDITLALLANDILDLLNELSIEKVIICGYSNGGSIALEFALNNPNRIEGIILIGGFPEVNTLLLSSEFKLGIYTVKMKGINFLAKVLGKAHGTTKEYKKALECYIRKTNPEILYQMYVKGLKYKCTHRLNEIKVPVLLIDGALDFYMHSYQKLLKREIPNSRLVLIPKARHQIPTRKSTELNHIINEFVEEINKNR